MGINISLKCNKCDNEVNMWYSTTESMINKARKWYA